MKRANHPGLETLRSGITRGKANPDTSHLHRASPESYYRAVPYEVKTEVKEEGNSPQRSDEELLKEIFKVQYEQLQTMILSQNWSPLLLSRNRQCRSFAAIQPSTKRSSLRSMREYRQE